MERPMSSPVQERRAGEVGESRTASASLGLLVGRVEHRMSRRVEAALGGPTLEQWRVLDLLSDGEGHPMTEIATHAMVPPPTLTKIVDRLIESTLVYRRPDEADRRRILVFLSERGQEEHDTLAPRVALAEQDVVADLDQADLARLTDLLERLSR
jgi:DNA-binding MarR family transcriptional regulator